ncbi:uncharacterized protein LOC127049741 [Gopherus flavomarginatus]|uniref:uncharacterized protein LOC127049741 n=1 Tax=Gopherus flavomarginatus TaxID=286002 RepID=UPI0021CBE772|nr:uncharacterized protein LOC127049741 [Gopherus flavomarginatus]
MRYLGVTPPPIRGPRWTLQSGGGSRGGGGRWGEEETESEGTGMGGDTPESQEACSQELFSSQEEGSQSQQPVFGEGQAEERVPGTLTSRMPVLSTAERLQNLRKKPRKSKDDLLQAVMDHSARENQKLQDWKEKESRIHQRNAAARKKSTKQLISILARQADSIQVLVDIQAEHYHANPLPRAKALSLVPQCQLQTPFPSIQVLTTTTSCLQHLYVHQPALRTTTLTLCTQPPSPCSIGILKCSSHCTALQT